MTETATMEAQEPQAINALPEEIVLDPGRAAERAWRTEAAALYDTLEHEQRLAWACDCIEHAPEYDGALDVVGRVRGGTSQGIRWPSQDATKTGIVQCLRDLSDRSGLLLRPGVGVASWCQVLTARTGAVEAERAWQLERLRELAG